MEKKIFLLDTNVLLLDPKSIFNFEGALIGIPSVVLEEVDKFKREGTDRGRNSRQFIRELDELRQKGSLKDGVKLENGSTVRVVFLDKNDLSTIPFSLPIEDNEILLTAYSLKNQGFAVRLITKDLNVRVKADALGIDSEDYISEYVTQEEFYKGWRTIAVPAVQLKQDLPKILEEYAQEEAFELNEFALVESQHNPHNYRVFRYVGNKKFISVEQPRLRWPLRPRNAQQLMALNLLLDPSIQLVNLVGTAGTGKTFLALLAGLHQILVEDLYEKMLIARPVVPLGRDVGFLPGTLQEKLYTWMLPVYDNMEFIYHASTTGKHLKDIENEGREKYRKGGKSRKYQRFEKKEQHDDGKILPLDEMVRRGKISLEAITYMRGRSIPYQYILIDEVQNLTPHEVKTLISRVGEGSKIVLAGDPYQIDVPYLDFSSNGLIISGEKLKGQPLFGSVYLEVSERSQLSQLAADLL